MNFLTDLFSQILGGGMGALSDIIGGPASQQGTLFSLPGELGGGIENLLVSENIPKDILNLAKPVGSLVSKGAGDLLPGKLSALNPFSSTMEGMSPTLKRYMLAAPFLGLGAYAAHRESQQQQPQTPMSVYDVVNPFRYY